MNYKKIIIFALIIIFIIIALYSISGFLTPYVTFKKAIDTGKYVQIIGKLDKTDPVVHKEQYYTFIFKDNDGTSMKVLHRGSKPLNFEHANQIVALGVYNTSKGLFEADRILIKCPSKYIKEK
ncbi:MAG: cytochrome c maturation protein CcmE [Spirochaetota bacterium]|nr:cytochrome c maturation protein CcmE [Spirochaetota bacterium]